MLRPAGRSTPVIAAGLLLTVAVVLAQAAAQVIDFHFFDLGLPILDSGHHRSVFGIMSILAQGAAAGAIGIRAALRRRLSGVLAAALVGALIVPRALKAHEVVFKRYDVPILMVPLAIVFVVALALTFHDPKRVRSMVWAALALLACSFALHAVGPQADIVSSPHVVDYTWAYQLTGIVKHGTELAGWMLLITGLLAGAWSTGEGEVTVNDIALRLGSARRTARTWIDRRLPVSGER